MNSLVRSSGILAVSLFLVGCIEDTSSEGSSTSTGSGGNVSASSCGYTDLISASERNEANQCGVQVSSQFAAADSYYDTTLQICEAGDRSSADQYYERYKQQVSSARSVASGFNCDGTGDNGGSFEDTSGSTYYSRCSDGYISYCRGPGQRTENTCRSSETLRSRHSSLTACQSAISGN